MNVVEKKLLKSCRIHMLGIGGIGMAGLAFLLKERGHCVSGSDAQENRQTKWLREKGVSIQTDVPANVEWIVRSRAVPDSHPDVARASVPVSWRGDVLPVLLRDRFTIAVSGTHGKTTTSSMIAQILDCGYCIGGETVGFDGVARDGDIMVVEADESDGTVANYHPDIAVITNIEYDHMEHHKNAEAFEGCFKTFISNTKQTIIYCEEDPAATRLCKDNPKAVPYGLQRANLDVPISLPGRHNRLNACAAVEVSKHWKSDSEIFQALENLRPINRRFQTLFDNEFTVISDYAHHPTEIKALIETALETLAPKRLLGIFQPHRYTRTLALGPDFPSAFQGLEKLWLLPVYAASEKPIDGGTTQDLQAHFSKDWKNKLHTLQTVGTAWQPIRDELRAGDVLLIIGAGDIDQLGEQINQQNPEKAERRTPIKKHHHIAVLKGGFSEEREVSLNSGTAVAAGLREAGYIVTEIDVSAPDFTIPDGIDAVFIALHGTYGEDGGVQARLEELNLPYVGAGVEASQTAFDKCLTQTVLQNAGIPVPESETIHRGEKHKQSLPLVVKPPKQGSSVGCHIIFHESDWAKAFEDALQYDSKILVQKFIPGREFTVGIIDRITLPVVEIVTAEGWYDYTAKYEADTTRYIIPAELPEEKVAEMHAMALKTFDALDCRGFGRVDFRMTPTGELFVLELNTIPGFTAHSLLPKAAAAAGIDFPSLCARIIQTIKRPPTHPISD